MRKVLSHAHHGIIDRRVTVRVVLAQHLTDDAGALAGGAIGLQAQAPHGKENAPLHRLEAVAHVRQGARGDDAHGIVQVGLAHLLLDVYALYCSNIHETPMYAKRKSRRDSLPQR
jgi:hypothetical protein